MLFDLAPGRSGYDEIRGNQLYGRVADRLRQTSGVISVSLSAQRLISGWMSNADILVDGAPPNQSIPTTLNFVGPGFLRVMGIPVILGAISKRAIWRPMPRVAVISETIARREFGAAPIGRRFRWSFKKDWDVEVVGVAKDAKYDRLRGEAHNTVYAPYTQRPFGWPQQMSFEVRTAGKASLAIAAIRRSVAEVDPMLPLTEVKTQEGQIDDTLTQERLLASLLSLFGVITLVLACVGLYGLVAYSITSRTREIGVRMALGAGRSGVLRMLLGQVAICIAAGLTVGLPLTWALSRVIASQLYGIKPHDPVSLLLASFAVAIVAALAAFVPARCAMCIVPVHALRYE